MFAKGGIHFVSDVSHLESEMEVLENNMFKELSIHTSQASQTYMVSCSHYRALDNTLSSWLFLLSYLLGRSK